MQPMIPPKRCAIFPPVRDAQRAKMRSIFFKNISLKGSSALLGGAILFSCAIFQHVAQNAMARCSVFCFNRAYFVSF